MLPEEDRSKQCNSDNVFVYRESDVYKKTTNKNIKSNEAQNNLQMFKSRLSRLYCPLPI